MVIFALFTFKGQIRQPNVFKTCVIGFTKKRIPWKINLKIDTGEKMNREDERDLALSQILDNVESDYMTMVKISFTTPLRSVLMDIDMTREEEYEKFLYE
jgi:hypothetical protein